MSKKYKLSLHIFRRDLRLHDNTALLGALEDSNEVIPAFIFDPRQIDDNPYFGENPLEFMLNCLNELDKSLKDKGSKLYIFYGKHEKIVDELLQQNPIEAIYLNRDYTPYSRKRDQAIGKVCQKNNADMHTHADALLQEPEQVHKNDGTPYVVYSAFYRAASQLKVAASQKNKFKNYYSKNIKSEDRSIFKKLQKIHNPMLAIKGGRTEAKKLLKTFLSQHATDYKEKRDFPDTAATSLLSAHNKFGTLSIREIYYSIAKALNTGHTFIRELYWRDFFTHIAFHFPHVFKESFHAHYKDIAWSNSPAKFKKWCEGQTGFPIVDAGMRELNETGYMHNRVRMIVASFLTKDLHLNWQWGEKYFAQKLIDYDPSINNGNWQWAASTGCDAQPYFRIFNPWLQQQKFDAEAIYIKKWVPELEALTANEIHKEESDARSKTGYPKPMLNHKEASAFAKTLYKSDK